ncbi:hypothetical protein H8B15_11995 [Hymenobacter sp. BT507]|uniref:Streptomycin biosynthesis protein StrF domain-containing protein n=1 Tax=Hymenobacter citatus TaxID=2763506 RepID=A0ABR7MKP1_9BACT|nr:glycosyltransferase [Hymenobacter citatus]MBC6611651.1 hypothetical protein [Hymenobacter citatus]
MLSIIICSRDVQALQAVQESVASTIGVPYEIVAIDNSKGQYGICEAYNVGAARSQYDLLCFMHEDIRFHTHNWGATVAEILADTSIGVLGVTGGMYQVKAPAPWWGCGLTLCRENLLNILDNGQQVMELRNPDNKELEDVAVVDGVWMCSRKEVWHKYPFDATTFSDFHFYDIDYCTEIFSHRLRVCVTFRLLIEHHSRGSLNDSWVRNALKYQSKRHNQLPFGTIQPPVEQSQDIELRALQEFTGRLIRGRFSKILVLNYLSRCLLSGPLNRDTLWLVKRWLRNT